MKSLPRDRLLQAHRCKNAYIKHTCASSRGEKTPVRSTNTMKVKIALSCPTVWDPMDCSPPGCSVYGILQARILGWVAILFSRASSRPKDQTHVSHTAGRLYHLSHQESHYIYQIKVEETQSIFTLCYRFILRNEPFPGTYRLSIILWSSQLSPTLLAPGTSFMGDNFSMDQGWGDWFGDDSRALHLLCNFSIIITSGPPWIIGHLEGWEPLV